jgi:hypothetical protein
VVCFVLGFFRFFGYRLVRGRAPTIRQPASVVSDSSPGARNELRDRVGTQ